MSKHIVAPDFSHQEPVARAARQSILIVCDKSQWLAQGRDLSAADNCWYIEIDALTRHVIARLNPDMVLSPLVGDAFDALDVAHKLAKLAYTGPYRAVTHTIPDPNAVCNEVRATVPRLDFDLVVIPKIALPKPVLDPA